MEFAPLLMLLFVVNKFVDWLRALIPDHLEDKILIPASWISGACITYAFSLTEWADQINIGDVTLASLNTVAVLVLGVIIGAGGGVLNDFKPKKTVVNLTAPKRVAVKKAAPRKAAAKKTPSARKRSTN